MPINIYYMIYNIIFKLKKYIQVTKPGISRAQVLTVSIGYFLAIQTIQFDLTYWMLVFGSYFFSSSAAVCNNIYERSLDLKMDRTKDRVLAAKKITVKEALSIAIICFVLATYFLINVNGLTWIIGFITFITYVFVYTPLKQITWMNTFVGAVPGSLPLLGGWAASGMPFHLAGISLMLTLFCWQIPHFYALSIMYFDDYAKADFKMLPIFDNEFKATKRQIIIFTLLMILSSLYPVFSFYLGQVYFIGIVLLSAVFVYVALKTIANLTKKNAKKLFFLSIIYLMVWFLLILIDIVINNAGLF